MLINENDNYINKRKFFRIYLDIPLCAEISIISLNNKLIKTKPSNICIVDIGISGIKFSSNLKLPIGKNMLYEFKMEFLHKYHSFNGTIVRKIENENSKIFYGASFITSEEYNSYYFKEFNNLALVLKRNISDHGCKFCNPQKCPMNFDKIK